MSDRNFLHYQKYDKTTRSKIPKNFLGLGWIAFNNLNVLVNTYYTTH